ncbi:glycosyltransferase [Pontibacter sp. 172403-2]|nr:glycosyltransferase [Pontibacter sp. 172403-2]
MELIHLVDIIITTRNRVNDLTETLKLLLRYGIPETNIFIVDDASTDNTFEIVKRAHPGILIKYNSIAQGLISNRNYLMSITNRPFVLSLDDDSCFIDPAHVTEAISILQSKAHYGIFNFHVFNQLQLPEVRIEGAAIRNIKNFIGCGHIIKREVLEKVGLYREQLFFYCEELDFSLKAFKAGFQTVTRDDLIVHHRVDFKLRQTQKDSKKDKGIYGYTWRNMMLSSNYLIVLSLYLPFVTLPSILLYYVPRLFWELCIRKNNLMSFTMGMKRYLQHSAYIKTKRAPLSFTAFREWIRLPMY